MPGRQTLTHGVPAAQRREVCNLKGAGGRAGGETPDPTAAGFRSGTRKPHSALEGQPGRPTGDSGWRQAFVLSIGPLVGRGADPVSPRPSANLRLSEVTPAQREPRDQTPPLTARRAGALGRPLLSPLPGDASACARSPASGRGRRGARGEGLAPGLGESAEAGGAGGAAVGLTVP